MARVAHTAFEFDDDVLVFLIVIWAEQVPQGARPPHICVVPQPEGSARQSSVHVDVQYLPEVEGL